VFCDAREVLVLSDLLVDGVELLVVGGFVGRGLLEGVVGVLGFECF
jgi:hypothetical protein